jgi:hypothetical protein
MKLPRPIRFAAAIVALISVLFTQLAVAAYACPDPQGTPADAIVSTTVMDAEQQVMPGCAELDMEQPVLCHTHVQAGDQSLDKPQVPNVSPAVAILLVPAMQDPYVAYRPVAADTDAVSLTRVSDPPLSIQHCCFRI